MSQTWNIKGQAYTHGQLMELKRQGLDPRRDKIVMKSITNQPTDEPEVVDEVEDAGTGITQDDQYADEIRADEENTDQITADEAEVAKDDQAGNVESDEEEFERLKAERAWVNPEKKPRYDELKARFATS